MVTNSKAIKKAEQSRISQIGDFKNRLGGIMELPSGLIVRTHNPGGMKAFLAVDSGVPNSLMSVISKSLAKGKAPTEADLMGENGEMDPKMLDEMMALMDSVAMRVIIEPTIHPNPTEDSLEAWNRDNPDNQFASIEHLIQGHPDHIFVQELPEDDKSFLFQWISGGTRDLEKFRQQLEERMDAVPASAITGVSPQHDNGADKR